jgi:hypothetical protein
MTKQRIFLDIALTLALLVPAPGRFAFGLIMVSEFIILVVSGIFMQYLIQISHIEAFEPVLMMSFYIFMAILFKEFLVLLSPVMALQLGFIIYFPALSSFSVNYFFEDLSILHLKDTLKIKLGYAGSFSLGAILAFLFRDIVGYGTLTLPVHYGMKQISVFSSDSFSSFVFFATIPGAVILFLLVIWLIRYVNYKLNCTEKLLTIQKGEEDE